MTVSAGGSLVQPPAAARPPAWLIGATGLLAAGTLAMAVAETSLWMHYLIDAGESVSLVGLAFMLLAGIHLYRRSQLLVSLPLAVPWLLRRFPAREVGIISTVVDMAAVTVAVYVTPEAPDPYFAWSSSSFDQLRSSRRYSDSQRAALAAGSGSSTSAAYFSRSLP